jgi:anti-sigma factor ChrR (cupin superfamily)
MTQQSAKKRKVVHADIKLNNKPELATRFLDVPNMPWEATKFPGIQIKVLYSDDEGMTTALFKLAPGAVVPLHEHTALEQTYVLEGSLEDHEGVCGPGQFCWRPAGNQHEAVAPKRRAHSRLLPQAQPLRLWREVLHRGRPAVRRTRPSRIPGRRSCRRA